MQTLFKGSNESWVVCITRRLRAAWYASAPLKYVCIFLQKTPCPSKILTINDSERADFFSLQLYLHIQDIKGNVFPLKEIVCMLEFLGQLQTPFVLSQFILFYPVVVCCFVVFCLVGFFNDI